MCFVCFRWDFKIKNLDHNDLNWWEGVLHDFKFHSDAFGWEDMSKKMEYMSFNVKNMSYNLKHIYRYNLEHKAKILEHMSNNLEHIYKNLELMGLWVKKLEHMTNIL